MYSCPDSRQTGPKKGHEVGSRAPVLICSVSARQLDQHGAALALEAVTDNLTYIERLKQAPCRRRSR